MPFRAEDLRQRFRLSLEQGRMGHAYLLTGDSAEALENLAVSLAGMLLGGNPLKHPDFHSVRPESKSRQITADQVRALEHELYLRPYSAPCKVAVILHADRMCIGSATAANAFLKTLEEPPEHTLILLTSERPAQLLPTIISRCLRLNLGLDQLDSTRETRVPEWIEPWTQSQSNRALRAYARGGVLQQHWAQLRKVAEAHLKSLKNEEMEKETAEALVEAEFQLSRQESIAELQRWYWRQAGAGAAAIPEPDRIRAVRALEDLQAALAQGIDANLAVDTTCLRIEGLLPASPALR